MKHVDYRALLAPVVTGALLLAVWTVPRWSEPPTTTPITLHAQPQLIGPGAGSQDARETGYQLDVSVEGASTGQSVRLDMWSDGRWTTEDEGTTDENDSVQLRSSGGVFGRVVTEMDGTTVTTPVDPVTVGPFLHWTEEFPGDALDSEWLQIPQPDDGGTCTHSDRRAVSVSEGLLALSVKEHPQRLCKKTGQPARINGHIILRGIVSYGTTAARIKLPRSRDVTGQFWLQPGEQGQRWVMDAQHEGVVVAETAGTNSTPRVDVSVNRTVDGSVKASRRPLAGVDMASDGQFHVYSVSWTPDGYTFSIDGVEQRRISASAPAPPMTIALAVTSSRTDLPVDVEDRTMYVDWLRVWAP